jgi:hypothetical protein
MSDWNDDTLFKEFNFLREKINQITFALHKNEIANAAFGLGCLYTIVQRHALDLKDEKNEMPKM